jgi:hypothetical protein
MESDYWNISQMNGSPLGCYDNGYMDTIMWTLPHEKVDDVAQYFNTLENIHLTWMEYISNFFFYSCSFVHENNTLGLLELQCVVTFM